MTTIDRAGLDSDHEAKPYDMLLRAGICLHCGASIRIDDRGYWTHGDGAPETPRVELQS
jgi:hypothetical protein